ncbi:MAG TPA: hypothetical protein VFD26_00745, partial [Methyloceanibacter sp.]|nr:hypothetical protein [Methyloceanibacter sp.]
MRASSIGQYIAKPAFAMKYAVNCSNVLRMNRLLMSTGEFGFGTRPTNMEGSLHWRPALSASASSPR